MIFFTKVFKKKQIYHVRNVWTEHQEKRHSESEENDEECWHCDIERWKEIDTNEKNDWINNDLSESNDLTELEILQEFENIEFTNEVNEWLWNESR